MATNPFNVYRAIDGIIATLRAVLDTINKPAWLTPPASTTETAAVPVYYPPIIDVGGETYAYLTQIIATQAQQATLAEQNTLAVLLAEIAAQVSKLARPPPTRIAVELPSIMRKGSGAMANFEINDDWVVTATIKTTDAAGNTEPVPAGDVFTASSSSPSLGVAIGTDASGNPAVVMTPMVQASPNITVTVSDSAGLMAASFVVDIVPDITPTNIVVDLADATHATQPTPSNPGP